MARILVVDDDSTSLELTQKALEQSGHDVICALSGKDAVSGLSADHAIDIIITDIALPVMTGFQLLSYLKADPQLSWIPVVLCTDKTDAASVKKGIKLGAAEYITKPIDRSTLSNKVESALTRAPGAVLVVDDEELLRDLLRKALGRAGFRVRLAGSGAEALEILQSHRISIMLADIKMPQMSGIELLTEVKEKHPTVPVLLMTGHGGDYSEDEMLEAGADGYIAKPFKNMEIISLVRSLVP
ncbi:MAG: response regulator [Candidatus Zixiibacteriota bacterium]|nr:MAG: response regulator [candidate division Zixibacteria bacterium]